MGNINYFDALFSDKYFLLIIGLVVLSSIIIGYVYKIKSNLDNIKFEDGKKGKEQ